MATTETNIPNVPSGVATPDRVETRLGTLNFTDGVPDDATAQKLFDELGDASAQHSCGAVLVIHRL